MLLHHYDRSTIHDEAPRWPYYLALALAASLLTLFLFVSPALAAPDPASAPPPGQTLLSGVPVWALAVGALVPLVTYVVNRLTLSEPVAASVLLVATTVAGALTQLVDAGSVGFDANTLKYVLSATGAALLAHHAVWKPGGVNSALGRHDAMIRRHSGASRKPRPEAGTTHAHRS